VQVKTILFFIASCLIMFGAGVVAGSGIGDTHARRELEPQLGQLRGVITDAQVRSDTAIRGLDEAIAGLGTIKDRNKRIEYLIDAIRATVVQLRAIYDGTSQAMSTLEDNSNRQ